MEYISVTDTAKLIRKKLAATFPGIKFSVKCDKYSGGASIDIAWTDGPLDRQVQAAVAPFNGAGFDGMIDLQYYYRAWILPDGSVISAGTKGTAGSGGTVLDTSVPSPCEGAKLASFGANYIHTKRKFSVGMYTRATEKVCSQYGVPMPMIAISDYDGSPRLSRQVGAAEMGTYDDLATLIYRDLQKRTNYLKAVQ